MDAWCSYQSSIGGALEGAMLLQQCAWAEARREAGRNNRRPVSFQAFVLLVGGVGLFVFGTCWRSSGNRSGNEYDEDTGLLLPRAHRSLGGSPCWARQDRVRKRIDRAPACFCDYDIIVFLGLKTRVSRNFDRSEFCF